MSPMPKLDEDTLKRMEKLLKQPRTPGYLSTQLGISMSTVYRYFGILIDRGVNVQRVGISRPTQYVIR